MLRESLGKVKFKLNIKDEWLFSSCIGRSIANWSVSNSAVIWLDPCCHSGGGVGWMESRQEAGLKQEVCGCYYNPGGRRPRLGQEQKPDLCCPLLRPRWLEHWQALSKSLLNEWKDSEWCCNLQMKCCYLVGSNQAPMSYLHRIWKIELLYL